MARKTTISREGLEFLIGAVKNTINIGDIINNEDLADNKTYSNIKIEERIDYKIDEKLANFAGSGYLTDYQEKTDNTLTTTDKTIVGAINELKTGVSSISVPTKVSQLTNDSGYLSTEDITTTINSTSTDTQVPSAKAVYDGLENINDFSVQVIKEKLNLNNITETGIYFFSRIYTPINTPTGANGWLLVMKGSYSDIVKQVWYSIDTADSNSYDTFERYNGGDTWSEWTKFLTETDVNAKLGDKADKSYVDDNFATMNRVKDGYAKILKNKDTDTNEAMFIAYKNRDLFGLRIYKNDDSEHELKFSASGISYVKNGVTVWTTSGNTGNTGVADVPNTVIVSENTKVKLNSNCYYTVINGVCYVTLWGFTCTEAGQYVVNSSMPKTRLTMKGVCTYGTSGYEGGCAYVLHDGNGNNKLYVETKTSEPLYGSFSYPVAE